MVKAAEVITQKHTRMCRKVTQTREQTVTLLFCKIKREIGKDCMADKNTSAISLFLDKHHITLDNSLKLLYTVISKGGDT